MSAILGTTAAGDLSLDLDRLIGGHLGIVANAGGGKSGLIRRLLEQTHSHVQHIVLDIEDEFYTLRQHYDYVIAGGQGGDAPATVANAGGLANAALAHGFSLICQLNDLGGDGASKFVDNFLGALMSAPQDLWRPLLIVIDETQRFNPAAIRMLTERGRKRGFTAILASQRLSKIDANIRGDLNNWLMGRVGQALDRRIMADQLGMSASDKRLGSIEERHFFAMGPALTREPTLFRVGDVETAMVRPGQGKVATPPPPEAMREILSGLSVPVAAELVPADPAAAYQAGSEAGAMIRELQEANAEQATIIIEHLEMFEALTAERDTHKAAAERYLARIKAASHALGYRTLDEMDDEDFAAGLRPAKLAVTPESTGEEPGTAEKTKRLRMPRTAVRPAETSEQVVGRQVGTPPRDLTRSAQKMVDALAKHYPRSLPIEHVAKIAGVSTSSSQWRENRRSFEASHLVRLVGDQWQMTVRGVAELGLEQQPNDPGALLDFWMRSFPPSTGNMLRVLVEARGDVLYRELIAEKAGVSPTSSGLSGGLRELQTHGLIEGTRDGFRATAVLL